MTVRLLTEGEKKLARSVYRDTINLDHVEVRRRKWFPFQPRETIMAPTGHLHFHPKGSAWREDFSKAELGLQGLFIHELCHVWQTQRGIFLPLKRHPFCRYHYRITPGWTLDRYGLEQQAEIVRHAFIQREGGFLPGLADAPTYEGLLRVFR
jgi:hypothetical protein